jgi:ubiquinone biosynthesis accessory factor UbiK
VLDSIDDAKAMPQPPLLEDLSARISAFLEASPAKDLEKNLRALLSAAFARLDLATREELDVQIKVLARTRENLTRLEARVAELEANLDRKK